MKKKSGIVIIVLCGTLLMGCGKEDDTASIPFPEKIYLESDGSMEVDAVCAFPESGREGNALTSALGDVRFWEEKDEIRKWLFDGEEAKKEQVYTYPDVEQYSAEKGAGDTVLYIDTKNYLTFSTELSRYVLNVINMDDRFDSYNGNCYQESQNLSFMSQKEAWDQAEAVFDRLGISASEDYTCYVMDHNVMQEQEEIQFSKLTEYGEKVPEKKPQWTESDDCYFFRTREEWNGYPVIPVITGEGIDSDNISVMISAKGMRYLSIRGYCPLKKQEEINIQNPEAVIEALKGFLGNLISEDTYTVQKLTLCQKVTGLDLEKGKARIEPAWECRIMVKPGGSMENSYIQKIYFQAETLKQIG